MAARCVGAEQIDKLTNLSLHECFMSVLFLFSKSFFDIKHTPRSRHLSGALYLANDSCFCTFWGCSSYKSLLLVLLFLYSRDVMLVNGVC